MTVDQNDVLVDRVRGSGKNLTTIYITHGHRDHLALVVRTGILPMASRLMCRLCGLDRNSRIGMLWACCPFYVPYSLGRSANYYSVRDRGVGGSNELRAERRVACLGRGRDAEWSKTKT